MSEAQAMIKILEKMPDNISMDDVMEVLNIIHDLRKRTENFDESKAISQEDLEKEIEQW